MFTLKSIFLGLIGLIFLMVLTGLSTQAILTHMEASKYTPPGQLVDVGGYKLHIHCTGQGSPTVVLEAGLGSIASSWTLVQREVAKSTRVCSYDRAGYGFSDSGPLPRTSSQMIHELHVLLTNAGEKTPFILVGHSLGGLNARMFEHVYPHEVGGLILIDSAVEEMLGSELTPHELWKPFYVAPSDTVFMLGRVLTRLGLPRLLFPDAILKDVPLLPEEKKLIQVFTVSTKCSFAFSDEAYVLNQSLLEAKGKLSAIGDKPLVVIVAGKNPDFEPIAGSKENAAIMQQEWSEFQMNLAKLSTNSAYVIAENSAHMIPFEQPNMIVESIQRMLITMRDKGG
jgi:pimeloyl-ACP methyl ester carboxylesterase